jgi:copper chaperone NosL
VSTRGIGGAIGLGVAGLVAGVVFLWPGPGTGPEPIQYGRDTCAGCRMPLDQPGFAGEMRDREGTLNKYDDVGCLLRAIFNAHREIPEAWVEDHDGAGFVPLLSAHLVRAEDAGTPMGFGIVAFKDEAAAARYAAAHAGQVLALEDVLRSPTMVARPPGRPTDDRGGTHR